MIRSFNKLVEMKNKESLKKNNLAVTYFLRVSLAGESSESLSSIQSGLPILPILKEKQETLTKVIIVIIGIHYIHPQN